MTIFNLNLSSPPSFPSSLTLAVGGARSGPVPRVALHGAALARGQQHLLGAALLPLAAERALRVTADPGGAGLGAVVRPQHTLVVI